MSGHSPSVDTSRAEWEKRVVAVLKGAEFKTLVASTPEGIRIEPLYDRRRDAAPVPGVREALPWRVSARVDHPKPGEASSLALLDLEQGADTLALVFAGSRSARGFGIASTVSDLDATLAGVDLQYIHIMLDTGPDALMEIKGFIDLVERRKLSPDTLAIDFGFDPIGIAAGSGVFGHFEEGAAPGLFRQIRDAGFKGPLLRADGRPYHEAGAGEAQELACLVATGVGYSRDLESAGIPLDAARQAISFLAVADCDEFLTIAKFRALRRLWARVEEASGLTPESMKLHAETAWRMLTKRDIDTNLLRNTIAAFSAGVGGADGVTVLPHSSAHGLPNASARRVARNTQLVLLEEANLWRVSDPVAGAGGFEALTDALCEQGWQAFQQIEREGGMLASLTAGHIQRRIAETRDERQKRIAEGREVIIGTTKFPLNEERPVAVLETAPAIETAPAPHRLPSMRLSEPFEA